MCSDAEMILPKQIFLQFYKTGRYSHSSSSTHNNFNYLFAKYGLLNLGTIAQRPYWYNGLQDISNYKGGNTSKGMTFIRTLRSRIPPPRTSQEIPQNVEQVQILVSVFTGGSRRVSNSPDFKSVKICLFFGIMEFFLRLK